MRDCATQPARAPANDAEAGADGFPYGYICRGVVCPRAQWFVGGYAQLHPSLKIALYAEALHRTAGYARAAPPAVLPTETEVRHSRPRPVRFHHTDRRRLQSLEPAQLLLFGCRKKARRPSLRYLPGRFAERCRPARRTAGQSHARSSIQIRVHGCSGWRSCGRAGRVCISGQASKSAVNIQAITPARPTITPRNAQIFGEASKIREKANSYRSGKAHNLSLHDSVFVGTDPPRAPALANPPTLSYGKVVRQYPNPITHLQSSHQIIHQRRTKIDERSKAPHYDFAHSSRRRRS